MENNVIISIQGRQSYEQAEEETIELVTEGCLQPDGAEGYTLSYQESELTGLEGTLTTFQIERDRVTLLRMGRSTPRWCLRRGGGICPCTTPPTAPWRWGSAPRR